ncbi:MAG: LapA family protein [Thermodesulfobacteriota bacterium]|jgi:uncharacterized integral membrane protein
MNAKIIGIIVLLVVLVIFAIQNTDPVPIRFLFWGFKTTAVLSILVSFLIGFLAGWLISWVGPKKKKGSTPSPI